MALGAVARIGGGWPSRLLSWWCCSRQRSVCPFVSGRGGTIPRSRGQVRGVFPGGRAHRAAVGLRGDVKQRAGRSQPVGLLVVGELAEQVVRGWQIRNLLRVGLGDGPGFGSGSPRWRAGRVVQRVRPRHVPALDLVTRVSSETARGLTPTTRVAHPDPGHRSPTARVFLASTVAYRSGPPSDSGKAQLSQAYGSGGWGFESLAARHQKRWSAALSEGRWFASGRRTATRLRPR